MNASGTSISLGSIVGRSLFPISAIAIVVGAVFWGPWVSLILAYLSWRVAARIA